MPSKTATGDFGPAEPGLDLTQNQTGNLLGAVIPVAVLGTTAVILRLVVPMKTNGARKLAVDDYLIIAALLFSWGTAISCFITLTPDSLGIQYGNGYHLQSLTKGEFITVWKILFAYVMIYATAVTCIKASIVFFYGRIFNFRWSLGICMFLVIGYWISVIVTVAVACRPLPYFWLAYTDPTAIGCLRGKHLPDHRASGKYPRNRRYVDYSACIYLVVGGTLRWDYLRVPPDVWAFLSSVVLQNSDRALIKQS
ncbi:hypothetical protein N7472_001451 [Penicillium cf. griseofulvum]|uniref:Rhodopsin domain-containing protein n=1 Tax=Penicillium cf. griseofulvum TaxID=2972120 RepID=A0A9W9N1E4_9EURO|nr:hypothetical protein N7472_001451 [Penicillium cf. griseofulvum]